MLWAVLLLTGCTPLTRVEQPIHEGFAILDEKHSLGQTFTPNYDGLQEIKLYLQPEAPGDGLVTLDLWTAPEGGSKLRSASKSLEQITKPGYYRFDFSPLPDSNRKDYYINLRVNRPGSLQTATAKGETYLDGSLYQNKAPAEGQLTFALAYDWKYVLWGLFKEGLVWLLYLVISFFLFVIPGWALLSGLLSGWNGLHWAEKLGLSIGISLAIYPLMMLWTWLIRLQLGALYAWLPGIAGLAYIAWRGRGRLLSLFLFRRPAVEQPPSAVRPARSFPWPDLALMLVIGLVFAVRLWVIRSLDFPMWGDSYQHTVIAQLLVDNGGLFSSWQPYAEMTTFTYHFGFHSLVAAFHWLTKLTTPQATLWIGQILNGLAIIALLPLVRRISHNTWAGVAVVLVAGLLVPMPMFYINWGRYTQLAGQAILPAAICLSWAILEAREKDWRPFIPAWIALGGLALAHYRVLIFAVAFFIAYAILQFTTAGLRSLVTRILWLGIGGGVLFLPWFANTFAGKTLTIFQRQLTTPASQVSDFTQSYNSIGNIFTYLPALLWLALPIVIGWGLWRRHKDFAILCLWWYLVFLAANPEWLHLPGTGSLSNFAVFIAAYMPVSVLAGGAIGWFVDYLQQVQEQNAARSPLQSGLMALLPIALCLFVAGFGLWGARQRTHDVSIMQHALVARPDVRAARWIRQNTSQEACFLINSFPAYGGSLVVGADAGWWLPLLANRQASIPPLNYGSEQGPYPGYAAWINRLTAEIMAKGLTDPAVLSLLREHGCEYAYIGQQQGRVNNSQPFISPEAISGNPYFETIYHQDRVWIFRIVNDAP